MSLRSRLLAGMTFIAVVLIAAAVTITLTTRAHLINQVDDRLSSVGGLPPDLDDHHGSNGQQPQTPDSDDSPSRISDVYQGFVDSDGTLVTFFAPNFGNGAIGAPNFKASDLPASGRAFCTLHAYDSNDTYRVLAVRSGGRVGITGILIDDELATMRRLIAVEVLG